MSFILWHYQHVLCCSDLGVYVIAEKVYLFLYFMTYVVNPSSICICRVLLCSCPCCTHNLAWCLDIIKMFMTSIGGEKAPNRLQQHFGMFFLKYFSIKHIYVPVPAFEALNQQLIYINDTWLWMKQNKILYNIMISTKVMLDTFLHIVLDLFPELST